MIPIIIRRPISRGIGRLDPEGEKVYLTYDDGPEPEVTPQLLQVLAEAGATATFFVIFSGEAWWLEMLRRIASEGHGIALHGLWHRSNFLRSNYIIYRSLSCLKDRILQAGLLPLNLYRPPYGHVRPDTVPYLAKRGLQTVLWSSIPGDYRPVPVSWLYRRAARKLHPGAIYALHDGVRFRPAPVVELTRLLLDDIRRKGWQAAALPAL